MYNQVITNGKWVVWIPGIFGFLGILLIVRGCYLKESLIDGNSQPPNANKTPKK